MSASWCLDDEWPEEPLEARREARTVELVAELGVEDDEDASLTVREAVWLSQHPESVSVGDVFDFALKCAQREQEGAAS